MISRPFPRPLPLAAGLAAALLALPVPACGPDFPNAYLVFSAQELAGLPTLNFAAELARALPAGKPPSAYVSSEGNDAELAEVREVLAKLVPRHRLSELLARYNRTQPPKELPAEFQLYAAGARAWRDGQMDTAADAWRKLLALPAAERRHRTVWAHYMIGRARVETDAPAARAAFQATRLAAGENFSDTEGLAVASLGWEARTYFDAGDAAAALSLYLQQHAAGDPGAATSVQMVLQKLFAAGEADAVAAAALPKVAADRQLRLTVTAWFTSRGGPFAPWSARATQEFRRWLAALPKDASLEPAEADRWAWAAYQNGLWSEAEAFATIAPTDAPASEWVRAMLLLRAGDLEAATQHLAGAAQAFPQDPPLQSPLFPRNELRLAATHEDLPRARLDGVRGVLALRREQYTESLRLFLTAGCWSDAAYVAEQVLTLPELTAFVREELPNLGGAPDRTQRQPAELRGLLARRLVRTGQFDAAREYFAPEFQPTFDRYVALVRDGYREENPRQLRALALWQAAQIVQRSGMELQGTELEPDFTIWNGNFEWPGIRAVRFNGPSWDEPRDDFASVVQASQSERRRVESRRPPTRRFHYRQRAAELAFLATTLLPDNDELTATILNTAGRWIAPRYPDDAQLFYKTLVFRCPRTALGKAAAERRWFVPPGEVSGL